MALNQHRGLRKCHNELSEKVMQLVKAAGEGRRRKPKSAFGAFRN